MDWLTDVTQAGVGVVALAVLAAVLIKRPNGGVGSQFLVQAFADNTSALTKLSAAVEQQHGLLEKLVSATNQHDSDISRLIAEVRTAQLRTAAEATPPS